MSSWRAAGKVCIIVGDDMWAEDIELHYLSLYHCAQLDCCLSVDPFFVAISIPLRWPDPAVMLETIACERITKLSCLIAAWISLLRHPDLERRDPSSLAKVHYGVSIMPVAVVHELLERLSAALVTPVPAGEHGSRTARRMARLGRNVASLTDACRVLATSPGSAENPLD